MAQIWPLRCRKSQYGLIFRSDLKGTLSFLDRRPRPRLALLEERIGRGPRSELVSGEAESQPVLGGLHRNWIQPLIPQASSSDVVSRDRWLKEPSTWRALELPPSSRRFPPTRWLLESRPQRSACHHSSSGNGNLNLCVSSGQNSRKTS